MVDESGAFGGEVTLYLCDCQYLIRYNKFVAG